MTRLTLTRKRGSILIVSLWIVAILSLLAVGSATRLRLSIRQTKWSEFESDGRELLSALAELSVSRLQEDSDLDVDGYHENWGRPFQLNGEFFLEDYQVMSMGNLDGIDLRIIPVDEGGKINVNFAPQVLLEEVFREVGARGDASHLAAAVVDWRDPDSVGIAESEVYAAKEPSYTASNRDLKFVEELLFVEGIDARLFFGEDMNHDGQLNREEDDGDTLPPYDNSDGLLQLGLIDMVTVYGQDNAININGASLHVVRAILRTVFADTEAGRLASTVIERRRGRDDIDGTDDDRAFTSDQELADAFGAEAYNKILASGIEFRFTSDAFRFYLRVAMPERHVFLEGDLVVLRENDSLIVKEWHEF